MVTIESTLLSLRCEHKQNLTVWDFYTNVCWLHSGITCEGLVDVWASIVEKFTVKMLIWRGQHCIFVKVSWQQISCILDTHNLGPDNGDEHSRFMKFTAEGRAVSCHYTGLFLTTQVSWKLCKMSVAVTQFWGTFCPLSLDWEVRQKWKACKRKRTMSSTIMPKRDFSNSILSEE